MEDLLKAAREMNHLDTLARRWWAADADDRPAIARHVLTHEGLSSDDWADLLSDHRPIDTTSE